MKKVNLTEGSILKGITKLSLPIIGSQIMYTAYSMVDMIWIGRIGSDAVAGAGTASFLIFFVMGIATAIITGVGIKVSQKVGEGNEQKAWEYAHSAFQGVIALSILSMGILYFFRDGLIGFFNIDSEVVNNIAKDYLTIRLFGLTFSLLNQMIGRTLNAYGDSKTPFYISLLGTVLNIILDPLFIFTFGFGVKGAAIATVLAQIIGFGTFMSVLKKKKQHSVERKFYFDNLKKIVRLGIPSAAQRILFMGFSMLIARIIAEWGPKAIAVQKIGIQIEMIIFMTAFGFQSALQAFVGQNFGAKKYERIFKGYLSALLTMASISIFFTAIFFLYAEKIFGIFIQDPESIKMGAMYVRIIAVSQVFAVLESMGKGSFDGMGKTKIPAISSIILTGIRIPMAIYFSKFIGLNGVWASISLSSILKGIVLTVMFMVYYKNFIRSKENESISKLN